MHKSYHCHQMHHRRFLVFAYNDVYNVGRVVLQHYKEVPLDVLDHYLKRRQNLYYLDQITYLTVPNHCLAYCPHV